MIVVKRRHAGKDGPRLAHHLRQQQADGANQGEITCQELHVEHDLVGDGLEENDEVECCTGFFHVFTSL